MNKLLPAVIALIIVITIVGFLFYGKLYPSSAAPSVSSQAFTSPSNFSQLYSAAGNVYNSSQSFNLTYKVTVISKPVFNFTNASFTIAKYGNFFRADLAYSEGIPINESFIPGVPLKLIVASTTIYKLASLLACHREQISNISPVNSTILSKIDTMNSYPSAVGCNTVTVPSNISSFELADSIAMVPIATGSFSNVSMNSITSPAEAFDESKIVFSGKKSIAGNECYEENMQNSSASGNITLDLCISPQYGLPLSTVISEKNIYTNSTTYMGVVLSSVNSVPSSASSITANPSNS
jgi:hypothetical protein